MYTWVIMGVYMRMQYVHVQIQYVNVSVYVCLCIPSCGCGGDGGREWGVREHETRDHIYITTIVFLGLCTTEDWYRQLIKSCLIFGNHQN